MAHPHRKGGRQTGKERVGGILDGNFSMAVLALRPRADLAAEVMNDEVKAITDAERGHAKLQNLCVRRRCIVVVNRRGPAGEHDADGLVALNFSKRNRAGQDHGEDVELANPARDELGVLRAEIEDNDCLGVHVLVWQAAEGDVKTM